MKDTKDSVREALNAAGVEAGHWGLAERTVLKFLEHLDTHYVGDMYLEQSLSYLRSTVESLLP